MKHSWRHPRDIGNTPGWEGEAGALLGWARWTVDGLHYLADLDAKVTVGEPDSSHEWDAIDLAHARWAASSAVGAVDLCAAALSRRLGVGPRTTKRGDREFDLVDLLESANGNGLPGHAAQWTRQVSALPDLELLTAIRHPTTHSRLRRHFFRGGEESERPHLIVADAAGRIVEVGEIVVLARETATTVVEDFFDQVMDGRL